MKFSRYNFYFPSKDRFVLYNCASDTILQIESQLMNLCKQYSETPEKIDNIAPPFYQKLLEKGFVVNDNVDEPNMVIDKWANEDESQDDYTIIINPTLNCNLKCWYCYEKHKEDSIMSPEILESSVKFIRQKAEKYENVHLSFFGGEPLLLFDDVVKPILESLKTDSGHCKAQIFVHITTNATLLNDEMVEYLKGWNPSFQIAIDGNEGSHNKVKFFNASPRATYSLILSNIKTLVENDIHVGLRCNYTIKTLPHFLDVLSDIKNWPLSGKKNLSVSFSRIWQDRQGNYEELETTLTGIEKEFVKYGFMVNGHLSQGIKRCYADKKNSIVINYDGNVYKCTARDFCSSNREGVLNRNGIVDWNDNYQKRLALRYQNTHCLECNIFPICRGGCSQTKLENNTNSCIRGYSENTKINFVQQRILDVYRRLVFIKSNH